VAEWGFLTNHARVLLHIAHDPGARLRDIAASLGITERRAHGIITDLAEAGYVITQKDGRRNRYQVQAHLPVPEPGTREPAIGEVVALFATPQRTGPGPAQASGPDADGAGHWPAQASAPDADGAGHWRAQASAPDADGAGHARNP
jgi:MarR family